MLKKAGLAMAVATAGVLALSPLAFADDDRAITQGEGATNGENIDSGHAEQVCDEAFGDAEPGGGECHAESTIVDQHED